MNIENRRRKKRRRRRRRRKNRKEREDKETQKRKKKIRGTSVDEVRKAKQLRPKCSESEGKWQ